MQVIGLTRFSYPALGGFQVEHDSIAERISFLWAEKRLEERFRLFETIALPCLKAQKDDDFDLVVMIGDTFPQHHVDRLHALCDPIPQIEIVALPPHNNREVCKQVLNAARQDPSAPCIQFRHDDDDAVSLDFVANLRAAAADVAPLTQKHRTVGMDWNHGRVAEVSEKGISATEMYRPFYVAALGVHVAANCTLTIHNFMHERIPRFMPCVTFPEPDMFVRTHNGYNDSRQKNVRDVPVTPLTAEEETLFRDRFAIDVDDVRRVFSAP
ncbi:putative rhamnosyl transferase [Tateyamaria sp. SN6-1]|uniref:putative rhamnosyl transferase n=1 Tax=Tateyamaria sp. SN6-1 TaxID=3092148 RepID=UPI0039F55079